MTKKEKKEVIKTLIHDIQQTSEIDEYATKRSQLFNEVLNSGYTDGSLQGVTQAIDTWCKDFDTNMEAKLSNQPPPLSKEFISMSAMGLLTLIDTSLLPD